MKNVKCVSREIAEYIYEVKFDNETVVYAPILQMAKLATLGITGFDNNVDIEDLSTRSREFVEKDDSHILRPERSPCDMNRMVILPNFKCNFKCNYCYAAKGRSNEEIDIKTLNVAMDWFLDKNRIPEKDFQCSECPTKSRCALDDLSRFDTMIRHKYSEFARRWHTR